LKLRKLFEKNHQKFSAAAEGHKSIDLHAYTKMIRAALPGAGV
jgi:hypothetical protein